MAYALITGSSKGIGRALAFELAERKFDLLLTARSGSLLKELANELVDIYGIDVKYLELDLSQPGASHVISEFIAGNQLALAVVVNNAGYGLWGKFEALNLRQQISMLRLNNESIVSLTFELLPFLHQQPQAFILNVASTAAYQAVPYMSVYAASKSFLVSFSKGLAEELKGSRVSVTCLSPGELADFVNDTGEGWSHRAKYSFSVNEVAGQAVDALFGKKVECIPGFFSHINHLASKLFPKTFLEGITAGLDRMHLV